MGKRVVELDLMRFVAALAVVLHHLIGKQFAIHPATVLGYLGVELFFMISGFVILATANKSGYDFVVSRVSRLYPSFWVSLSLTALVVTAAGHRIELRDLLANYTMFPGFLSRKYVDIVYWTLAIEAKFYAMVFLLIACRQIRHIEAWLAGWLLASLAEVLLPLPGWFRHLTLAGYAPLFIAGCLLYRIRTAGPRSYRLGIVVATLPLAIHQALIDAEGGLIVGVYVPYAVSGIVIAEYLAFTALALRWWSLPSWRVWSVLGAMTYPLYLVHKRVGEMISEYLAAGPALAVTLLWALGVALLLALTVERYACPAINRLLRSRQQVPYPEKNARQ